MDYKRLYIRFIFSIKRQERKSNERFYERHHILPKSIFPEYRNKENNIILVSPREHFVLHKILSRIYEKGSPEYHKMQAALFFMSKISIYKKSISSREFEILRITEAKESSLRQKGKSFSEEHKQHLRDAWKATSKRSRNKGFKMSEESKQVISEIKKSQYRNGLTVWNKGLKEGIDYKVNRTAETIERLRAFLGKHHSEETKQKIRDTKKGKCLFISEKDGTKKYFYKGNEPEGFILFKEYNLQRKINCQK